MVNKTEAALRFQIAWAKFKDAREDQPYSDASSFWADAVLDAWEDLGKPPGPSRRPSLSEGAWYEQGGQRAHRGPGGP